jgi:hypothetical protein
MAIQPDGKIVVAGEMGTGPEPTHGDRPLRNQRLADPSFGGGDGKVSIDFTPLNDFVRRPHPGGREDRRRRTAATSVTTRVSHSLGSPRTGRWIRRSAATGE